MSNDCRSSTSRACRTALTSIAARRRRRISASKLEGTDRDERPLRAQPGDQRGRGDGSDPDAGDREGLEDGEDAAQNGIRDAALDERVAGDVEDRVAEADEPEAHRCEPGLRPHGDQGDRSAPKDQPELEGARQPVAVDEKHGPDRPDHSARAERGVQVADARVADEHELDRDDHDDHVEEASDQGLARKQAYEQTRVLLLRERPNAREVLGQPGSSRFNGASRDRRRDPGDQERRDEEHTRARGEDRARARCRQQETGEQRADQSGDALERRRRDVRRHELARRSRERRHEREMTGKEGGRGDRSRYGQCVHHQRWGPHEQGRRGPADRADTDEMDAEEDVRPVVAIGKDAGEGNGGSGREHP